MPCDTVTTAGINVDKMPLDILKRGLTADGHAVIEQAGVLSWYDKSTRQSMTYNAQTGRLEASGRRAMSQDAMASTVKQSFSRELVRTQAAKYGWQVKQTGNTFQVVKGFRS